MQRKCVVLDTKWHNIYFNDFIIIIIIIIIILALITTLIL